MPSNKCACLMKGRQSFIPLMTSRQQGEYCEILTFILYMFVLYILSYISIVFTIYILYYITQPLTTVYAPQHLLHQPNYVFLEPLLRDKTCKNLATRTQPIRTNSIFVYLKRFPIWFYTPEKVPRLVFAIFAKFWCKI